MEKNVSRRDALAVAAGGLAGALVAGPLARASAAAEQKVTVYVLSGMGKGKQGLPGPDGKRHDAFVPSSFVVKAGVPVAIDFINYDEDPHTMTAPKLKMNIQVKGASDAKPGITTARFTVAQPGTYRWYCALTCDTDAHGWAMGQGYAGPGKEGYMAGFIVAI